MKKIALFALAICLLSNISAQNSNQYHDFSKRGEVYFSFQVKDLSILNQLTRILSIDNVDEEGNVIAYANEQGFAKFLEFSIELTVLTPPSMLEKHVMFTLEDYRAKTRNEWNAYPTYEAYIAMMNDFQTNFPHLCDTVEFGTTTQNRKLIACKLTSNLNSDKKVKIHLSSTMHGDETTGYVLLLRLIDYLLNNYATDPRIQNILDHAEVWICPNANPDGTYRTGNSNVNGATRGNANNVDLNRNYRNEIYGDHPDGRAWQAETLAFMTFQTQQKFHLGFNIHGGIEVVNYPWDDSSPLAADDSWWRYICREYADTVHAYAPANYMRALNNGITNGFAWYIAEGTRQDYANFYDHCREFTLEISNSKMPSANTLPNFWNYNYRSFLNFIEQGLYGIHGTVTDAETGFPVQCKIVIEGHDKRNSHVYSDVSTGYYVRPVKAGTYTLTYTAEGYGTVTRTVTIADKQKIVQDVQLSGGITANFSASQTDVDTNGSVYFTDESFSVDSITAYSWVFEGGIPSTSNIANPVVTYTNRGLFDVSLTVSDDFRTKTITKENYIHVAPHHNMQNGTIQFCDGFFFDEGGSGNNYSVNSNLMMTIKPETENSSLKITFLEFNVEFQPTCYNHYLNIYDGPTTSSPLLGKFCGTNLPGPFTSSAPDGSLTFLFITDSYTPRSGWKAYVECLPPTSILDNENLEASIAIYPNPAKDVINIEAKSVIKYVEIFDVNGKLILLQKSNSNKVVISTGNITPGVYLLRAKINDRYTTSRIIITE
ncbi:MAG: T9SS type A sorting domain-containing protein [Bacteroidales bacterium]|jgi:PKD repeat protein|nr:T9SS type A sorting domain-containing protein [Bacteroidales bacterium]